MSTAQNSSLIIIASVVVLACAGFVVMQTQHQHEIKAVMLQMTELERSLKEQYESAEQIIGFEQTTEMKGRIELGHANARLSHNTCSSLPTAGRWVGSNNNIRRIQLSAAVVARSYTDAVAVEVFEKCDTPTSVHCMPTMQIIYYAAPINGNWMYSGEMRDHILMTACHHNGGVSMTPKHITN